VAKKLKIRDAVGRPRLEDDQTDLLQTIKTLAICLHSLSLGNTTSAYKDIFSLVVILGSWYSSRECRATSDMSRMSE